MYCIAANEHSSQTRIRFLLNKLQTADHKQRGCTSIHELSKNGVKGFVCFYILQMQIQIPNLSCHAASITSVHQSITSPYHGHHPSFWKSMIDPARRDTSAWVPCLALRNTIPWKPSVDHFIQMCECHGDRYYTVDEGRIDGLDASLPILTLRMTCHDMPYTCTAYYGLWHFVYGGPNFNSLRSDQINCTLCVRVRVRVVSLGNMIDPLHGSSFPSSIASTVRAVVWYDIRTIGIVITAEQLQSFNIVLQSFPTGGSRGTRTGSRRAMSGWRSSWKYRIVILPTR